MELNRSDRSDVFQDRELLEAVLQQKEEPFCLNESGGSRLTAPLPLRSNGTLSRPSSFVSRRSITLSHDCVADHGLDMFDSREHNPVLHLVKTKLQTLSILSVCSLVFGYLSVHLLIALSTQQTLEDAVKGERLVTRTLDDVAEVATAFAAIVIVLNIMCLFICSMQCIVVMKLMKVHLGEERSLKYLKECSSSRFIAIIGFFVSIPAFLVLMILFMIVRFSSTSAIMCTVIFAVGIVFCILGIIQNSYHWRIERSRAIEGLPVYDVQLHNTKEGTASRELSTLV